MTLMVSICSGERSFSKMALIKLKLRSTMKDMQSFDGSRVVERRE